MDGNIRLAWVLAISNTSAPTTTELNAGVDITPFVTPDGWAWATTDALIDNTSIASVDDTSIIGRRGDTLSVTFKHQGDSAAPYTTFASRPAGFIVERTSVPYATAFATGQKLRILPAQCGSRQKNPRAKNELEKFVCMFAKTAATVDLATIA